MTRKRTRKTPYISGYCLYSPHQYPCKGEFGNGSLIKQRVTLCSCDCHGDYLERLAAAGQTLVLPTEEDEDN